MAERLFKHFESYQDMIGRLYPETISEGAKVIENGRIDVRHLPRSVTFQVTDGCNLACSYCYQINKGKRRMSFETAKKYVDLLLSGEKGFNTYVDPSYSKGIVFEFIGGEPFLEIELMDEISDYIRDEMIRLNHPWKDTFMFSICSNGLLYRDPRVQHYLQKNRNRVSFSVTLDGNKPLHDSCRRTHDGKPSYDLAWDACQDWMDRGYQMGSKITLAKENLAYFAEAIKHFWNIGYREINANPAYEPNWTSEDGYVEYQQLKEIADFLLERGGPVETYFAMFNETMFVPKKETEVQNWCGGTGEMLSCDPDGWLYPCIRYMESSLGTDQPPLRIGHVDIGIAQCKEHSDCIKCLHGVNRKSQCSDECFYCPIGEGCAWCSAYNYQATGSVDIRTTTICEMHKARALANLYYWNKWYRQNNEPTRMRNYVPEEWALAIIPKEELDMLNELCKED